MAYKKDEIEIYTDAISMAVYRSMEPKDFKEFFLALFKESKPEFSDENLYDVFDEYKKKVDADKDKYEKEKARKKKYYDKNK